MNWLDGLKIEDLPESYQEMAYIIGIEATLKLAAHYGKQAVYFKSLQEIISERKRRYIVEKFNGANHDQLARDTEYSTRYVYELLAEERNKKQPSLL